MIDKIFVLKRMGSKFSHVTPSPSDFKFTNYHNYLFPYYLKDKV